MKAFFKRILNGVKSKVRDYHRSVMVMVMTAVLGYQRAYADVISDVAGDITGYIPSVQKLMYAIAAVVALAGAFSVYNKMVNGDQDVKKTVMLTIGGCIAMVALSSALPAFFGYKGT